MIRDFILSTLVSMSVNIVLVLWLISYLEKKFARDDKAGRPKSYDMWSKTSSLAFDSAEMSQRQRLEWKKLKLACCQHCQCFFDAGQDSACPKCGMGGE